MSDIWGALAQSAPAATTLTDAYTVPQDSHATVEVVACNRGSGAVIRLSHAVAGEADAAKQYLLWDFAIGAGESVVTARFTVKSTDVIRVHASTADVTFNINGIEEQG